MRTCCKFYSLLGMTTSYFSSVMYCNHLALQQWAGRLLNGFVVHRFNSFAKVLLTVFLKLLKPAWFKVLFVLGNDWCQVVFSSCLKSRCPGCLLLVLLLAVFKLGHLFLVLFLVLFFLGVFYGFPWFYMVFIGV